ncbi:MAG: hypothetical protein F6K42_12610 [Leptolyngbya sp. SIO1D8]|nr:hypothetical protein [Leptolyngbya sp. SIO1D8]
MKTFEQQKAIGSQGEALLDSWLSRFYCLWAASDEQERAGIDRLAKHHLSGRKFAFQYKIDTRASSTGNAFVETCSVYRGGQCQVLGWAYTCKADYLFYLVNDGPLYICPTAAIKAYVSEEWKHYPSRRVRNSTWETEGLLVPLHTFEKAAKIVIGDPQCRKKT